MRRLDWLYWTHRDNPSVDGHCCDLFTFVWGDSAALRADRAWKFLFPKYRIFAISSKQLGQETPVRRSSKLWTLPDFAHDRGQLRRRPVLQRIVNYYLEVPSNSLFLFSIRASGLDVLKSACNLSLRRKKSETVFSIIKNNHGIQVLIGLMDNPALRWNYFSQVPFLKFLKEFLQRPRSLE